MTPIRAALAAACLATLLTAPAASADAAPGPAVPEPADVRCDGVRHAPPLPSDRNPDGTPVRTARDERGRWTPVVFVHGWTSRSAHTDERTGAFSSAVDLTTNRVASVRVPRSLIGQVQRLGGTEAFTFDYEQHSARWVTDDHLGPRLGRAIDCLHAATGERVIVVAHSMGGLVARAAAAVDGRAERLSRVITFGTPHTGSAVARAVITGVDLGGAVSKQVALLRMVLADCGAATSRTLTTGSLCDLLPPFVRAFDSAAGRALRWGSAELAALPPFPKGLPVHALLGEVDLHVASAGWFALPWDTTEVPMGDVIVTGDSARSGATSSRAASCSYQLSAARGAVDGAGLVLRQVSRTDVAASPFGLVRSACVHTTLMRGIELTNEALGVIADDVAARQPARLTLEDLRGAPVPSLCDHPPGRLVDGSLPGLDPVADGTVDLVEGLLADLDGDDRPEGIATLRCTYGGNADYLGVHVYRAGPVHVARADLEGDRKVLRSRGLSLPQPRVVEGLLEVTGHDGDEDDATCCPSVVLSRRFALVGDRLVVQPARPPQTSTPLTTAGWGSFAVGREYAAVARDTGWPLDVDSLDEVDDLDAECTWSAPDGGPGGVVAMGGTGRVRAVVVDTRSVRTERGVGVGSSEAEVLRAYGTAAAREDNLYGDVDDIVVGTDPVLRFEIASDDRQVDRVHAGEREWALLAEGCA